VSIAKISLPTMDSPNVLIAEDVPEAAVTIECCTEEIPDHEEDCSARDSVNYYWSQTMEDVDIRIPVESSITKGKQVRFSLLSYFHTHISIYGILYVTKIQYVATLVSMLLKSNLCSCWYTDFLNQFTGKYINIQWQSFCSNQRRIKITRM